jgi:hypothetical protein
MEYSIHFGIGRWLANSSAIMWITAFLYISLGLLLLGVLAYKIETHIIQQTGDLGNRLQPSMEYDSDEVDGKSKSC